MTMLNMNQQQAHALAALIATLRPGWNERGILAALRVAHDTITPDAWLITAAALTAAANPSNLTPAVIGLPGTHGPDAAPRAARADRGPDHPSYPADRCGGGRSDQLVPDDDALAAAVEARKVVRHNPIAAAGAAAARAALSPAVHTPVEEA